MQEHQASAPEAPASTQEIRQQIQETRDAIADKAGALESEVRETVDQASDVVKEQIKRVQHAFSLRHQVGKHPWPALAIAVAAGVLLQRSLAPSRQQDFAEPELPPVQPKYSQWPAQPFRVERTAPSILQRMFGALRKELSEAKENALNSTEELVADFGRRTLAQPLGALLSGVGLFLNKENVRHEGSSST